MQTLQTLKKNILQHEVSSKHKDVGKRRVVNRMIRNYTTNRLYGGGEDEKQITLTDGTIIKGVFHINPAFRPKLKSGTMTFPNGCTLTGDFNFRGRLKHGILKDKTGAIVKIYEQKFSNTKLDVWDSCKNKIGSDLEECYKNQK